MRLLLSALIPAAIVTSAALPTSTQDQCPALPDDPSTLLNIIQFNSTSTSIGAFHGDDIDNRMGCVYRISEQITVCPTSIYMTTVKIMVALSVRGYLDPMPFQSFQFENYTDVVISVFSEGEQLQTRHALLGLYKTVRMMTEQRHWNFLYANLIWQTVGRPSKHVGQIAVLKDPMPPTTGVAANKLTMVTDISLSSTRDRILPSLPAVSMNVTANPINESTTSTTLNALNLDLETTYRRTRILPQALFMALYTAFLRIAPLPYTGTVTPFVSKNAVGGKTRLTINYFEPGQSPNLFHYVDVSWLLGELADRALRDRKFYEVDFVIKVRDVSVGRGSLENVGRRGGAVD